MAYKRYLFYHHPSEDFVEIYSENPKEYLEHLDVEDVTGIFEYEQENRRLKGIPF